MSSEVKVSVKTSGRTIVLEMPEESAAILKSALLKFRWGGHNEPETVLENIYDRLADAEVESDDAVDFVFESDELRLRTEDDEDEDSF